MPGYQRFFARFVAHDLRGAFFARLESALTTVRWHPHQAGDPRPVSRSAPVVQPDLRLQSRVVRADLWTWLYQRQLDKILNDARVIADVATADEDRQARWALWDSLQKVATVVFEVAALVAIPFVPFLGELMLAYTAYQLLDETFHRNPRLERGATE